jgi:hypothetical protein
MWAMWLWVWPNLLPKFMSQRPFTDFAAQLSDPARVPPELHPRLRQGRNQDSRIIWFGDVRFPRLIDQPAMLREQGGKRNLDYEIRRTGEEMVRGLQQAEPVLLVTSMRDFLTFLVAVPARLAAEGKTMPPIHLWLQPRYGGEDRQYVLFSSRPPPFPEPRLRLHDEVQAELIAKGNLTPAVKALLEPGDTRRAGVPAPASAPATAPIEP